MFKLTPDEGSFNISETWETTNPLQCLKIAQEKTQLPMVSGYLAYDAARFFEAKLNLLAETEEPDLLAFLSDSESQKEVVINRQTRQQKATKIFSDRTQFEDKVRKAKQYILDGDTYQLVLSNQTSCQLDSRLLEDLSRDLLEKNPSPYHFMFKSPFGSLLGASPETFLQFDPKTRLSAMRLVAGTYKSNEAIEQLLSDPKELAEHNMLIDHARNDLAKHAETGSICVSENKTVDSYQDYKHLVSSVQSKLRADRDWHDIFETCFPICTLTGTPKLRAMQIIEELERFSRGTFGGSAFYIGRDGKLDSTVIIRSLFQKDGSEGNKAILRAGAGIVYDSDESREFSETEWKISSLWKAVDERTDR